MVEKREDVEIRDDPKLDKEDVQLLLKKPRTQLTQKLLHVVSPKFDIEKK